ncbi:unnamed protein product [Phaedon cochleariae]|uniref:Uncharacterized protein n=1 Tax=Phaedon cochleariae TaxID=80249 RepID=A0A9P0DHS9_PHACE|nr:unnamed protein product [Phaedon cochleariae]
MWFECVFLMVFSLSHFAASQLTLAGPKCGQRQCKMTEYCSPTDGTCAPCSIACNKSSHNYEEIICENKCQDYLHDLRYVPKDGSSDNRGDLRNTVDRLSQMVTVTLTLVCFMLVVLASFLCFQFYRWKDKKNITLASLKQKILKKKSSPQDNSNAARTNNALTLADGKKGDLRLEMPTPVSHSDHSPVTVTTSISRRPAEDSTLDYAYDNPAMTSSR